MYQLFINQNYFLVIFLILQYSFFRNHLLLLYLKIIVNLFLVNINMVIKYAKLFIHNWHLNFTS